LSLLDAQRQYQKARLGFVQAQAQRYQDTVQLLVAMGGGSTGATFLATGTVASPNPIFAKE
jgi:outer membrane protein TolC